jgi:hypothetical protein
MLTIWAKNRNILKRLEGKDDVIILKPYLNNKLDTQIEAKRYK